MYDYDSSRSPLGERGLKYYMGVMEHDGTCRSPLGERGLK